MNNMLKILGSITMILGGATLIILSFYNNHKEIMKIANKDNNRFKKYLKHKKIIKFNSGVLFCYIRYSFNFKYI